MARLGLFKTKKSAPAAAVKTVKEKPALATQVRLVQPFLQQPVVSEKATLIKDKANAYVFRVAARATKTAVAKEVERAYKVKTSQVRIINLPPKPKRMGRSHGYQAGYKKAIVFLKPGDKIELI